MTDKAIYMNNFPHPIHGSLQPLRLGGESNLKEGETMSEAWDRMHKEAVEWFRTRIGGSETLSPSLHVPPPEYPFKHESIPPIDYKQMDQLDEAIDNAKTVEELVEVKNSYPVMPHKYLVKCNKKLEALRLEANNKATGEKNL